MNGTSNMKNSDVLVKSKGVLIFAYNTDTVNYVSIAEQCARLVIKTLNLPVTLVTDNPITSEYFDQIVYVENTLVNRRAGVASGTTWRNGGRYLAYELSPYDETILLDSDYLILDQSLLTALTVTDNYRLMHDSQTPAYSISTNMGFVSLAFVWATVIVFKRTQKTELLFKLVARIQRNYEYYRQLYQITARNFRNDYAFAIANNMLNGYTAEKLNSIPAIMLTFDCPIKQISIKNSMLTVREETTAHVIPRQNIHVMDKDYLQSEKHVKFVNTICQE